LLNNPRAYPAPFGRHSPATNDNDNDNDNIKNHQIIQLNIEIDFYNQCNDLQNYACLASSTHSFKAISLSSVAKQ
jgi:hypothetical protein